MQIIALTGGIASGKSTVSTRLAELGAVVVDADLLAREVVQPGQPALASIVASFGRDVLLPDGTLDRPALGQLIFSDETARLKLNAITHPAVWHLARQRFGEAARAGAPVAVYDVPLLAEAAADRPLQFDSVLLVTAPVAERIRRMVADRGMSRADAEARIAAQATDEERARMADVVLRNDGTRAQLVAAVDRLWPTLSGPPAPGPAAAGD